MKKTILSHKKNIKKIWSSVVVRGYIPDLDNYSKVDVEDYLSSIEEYHNSDEEFFFTTSVERFQPGRLYGLINALRYIIVERPSCFQKEFLEDCVKDLKRLLHYTNDSVLEQKSLGEVERFVEYGYRRSYGLGRLYPNRESTSASSWVPRQFRGFLFPNHVDIDLESSHFSILATYAKKRSLSLPIIERLALKDEKLWLESGLSAKEWKKKSLKLLNYKRSFFNNAEGLELSYQKEIFSLRDNLKSYIFDNPYLTEEEDPICFNLKKFYSKTAGDISESEEVTLVSLYCQSVESEVLTYVLEYLKKKNGDNEDFVFNGVLMFDGLFVSNEQFNTEDLRELNETLKKNTGSKYLRLAIKNFEPLHDNYIKYILIALLVRNVKKLKDRHGLDEFIHLFLERKEFIEAFSVDPSDLEEDPELFYNRQKESILNAELSFGECVLAEGFDTFEKYDEETLLYCDLKSHYKKIK